MLLESGDELPRDASPSGETIEKESSGVVIAEAKASTSAFSSGDIFSADDEGHSGANVEDSKGIEGRKKRDEAEVEQEAGRSKEDEAEEVAEHGGRTDSPTAIPLNQSRDDERSLLSAIENVLARCRWLYTSMLDVHYTR